MSNVQGPRTIVAATDFSDDARTALSWAEQIAKEHGARLVLAHAITSEALPAPEFVPLPAEARAAIHAEAERHLEEEAAGPRSRGLAVDCELVLSAATVGILEIAERRGADLLVAGTSGRSGWKRALLGSVAARLVRQASCPVLTVHHGDGAASRPVRTVVVPTDFSPDAELALESATSILGDGGADRRLLLVHAFRVPIEAPQLPQSVLSEAIRECERGARERLAGIAEKLARPGLTVDLLAHQGHPSEVILDVARSSGADLIAMGTHGHSGLARLLLGSTAERVLPSATCPVLTVHRDD